MQINCFFFVYLLFILYINISEAYIENEEDYITISKASDDVSLKQNPRYLLYEINFGEGFNLRRDVYLRVANLVKHLRNKGYNYILVLPPWGNLYHWKNSALKISWNNFFDISSLNKFVPVIEFEKFIKINGNEIEQIVYLQHYAEGWTDDKWEEKFDIRDCIDINRYYRLIDNKWNGFFYSYKDVYGKNLTCLSLQGESKTVSQAIIKLFNEKKTIFIDRAETMLHDSFGDKVYWEIRRSMRYSKNLITLADDYIKENLDSNFKDFHINIPNDWKDEKEEERNAKGGNYISAHLRRRDFLYSHSDNIPSIKDAAKQLIDIAKKLKLHKVFICTDGDNNEVSELGLLLKEKNINLYQFKGNNQLNDGEIAIIDQIIASKSRYFIGTHSSTFSFRIREDREIMHFPIESSFNDFCNLKAKCEQPAKWTITYSNAF